MPKKAAPKAEPMKAVAKALPKKAVAEAFPKNVVAEALPKKAVAKALPKKAVAEAFPKNVVAEALPSSNVAFSFARVSVSPKPSAASADTPALAPFGSGNEELDCIDFIKMQVLELAYSAGIDDSAILRIANNDEGFLNDVRDVARRENYRRSQREAAQNL
jgi:hypothetical protein